MHEDGTTNNLCSKTRETVRTVSRNQIVQIQSSQLSEESI